MSIYLNTETPVAHWTEQEHRRTLERTNAASLLPFGNYGRTQANRGAQK